MKISARPILAIAFVIIAGVSEAQEAEASVVPTAQTLAERVATTWDLVQVRLVARLTAQRPNRPDSEATLMIRRSGNGLTRVDFLAPEKDRGKALLYAGDETWIYLPRTQRVIEVPARRSPLAGGILFDDLLDGTDAELASVEVTADAYLLVTHSEGKRARGKGAAHRIFFDKATLLPTQRESYSSSGRLLKTLRIIETREWKTNRIPWKIELEDHLEAGAVATLEVLSAEVLTAQDEELIARDRLSQPPAPTAAGEP